MSRARGSFPLALPVSVLVALLVAPLAGQQTVAAAPQCPTIQQSASSRDMAVRLKTVAEVARPWDNPYRNAERVALLRAAPEPTDPRQRSRRAAELANELLLAGATEEAIGLLEPQVTAFPQLGSLLAVAYLRLGEQRNCIARHGPDSCLLPLREGGVHADPRPARSAIATYRKLLEADPEPSSSVWLLNVAAMAAGDYPDAVPEPFRLPLEVFDAVAVGRFRDVAPLVGAATESLAGGVVVDDFDGDGDLDLVASSAGLGDPLAYLVRQADGSFADCTVAAGLAGLTGGLNLIHADYDNDGATDLYVLRGGWLGIPPARDGGRHPNSLLRNVGGTFVDVTVAAGLLEYGPTQTAGWGDYDNDGWLDLFVGYESLGDDVHPSRLHRNNGDGTFSDVTAAVGIDAVGVVKGVIWGDYDNDGWLDLYVSRLGATNLLWRNLGPAPATPGIAAGKAGGRGIRFQEVGVAAGVDQPVHSFPVWFFDYDNDGWLDLFVSGYRSGRGSQAADVLVSYLGQPHQAERPRLYRNRRDGTFEDTAVAAGLNLPLFTMGCNFGDLDNDGWLDMYLGTGDPDLRALVPNRMLRNVDGGRFEEVTASAGVGHLQKGHGIAFADFDGDGDQDIFAELGGFYSGDFYANALFANPGPAGHWLGLQLVGERSNRAGLGARVRVRMKRPGGYRDIHRVVTTGGSFGGSPTAIDIGLGDATGIESVTVRWPASGVETSYPGLDMNQTWRIREGRVTAEPVARRHLPLEGGDAAGAHQHHAPTGR